MVIQAQNSLDRHLPQGVGRMPTSDDNPIGRTFKQNVEDAGTYKSAFKAAWFVSGTWGTQDDTGDKWLYDDMMLVMPDLPVLGEERSFHAKVKTGYIVRFRIVSAKKHSLYIGGSSHTTDVLGAFKEVERDNDFGSGKSAGSWSNNLNLMNEEFDEVTFDLREDDYISIDLFGNVSGTASFRIKLHSYDGKTSVQWDSDKAPVQTHTWVEMVAISDLSESAAGQGTADEQEQFGGTTHEEEARQQAEEAESHQQAAEEAREAGNEELAQAEEEAAEEAMENAEEALEEVIEDFEEGNATEEEVNIAQDAVDSAKGSISGDDDPIERTEFSPIWLWVGVGLFAVVVLGLSIGGDE